MFAACGMEQVNVSLAILCKCQKTVHAANVMCGILLIGVYVIIGTVIFRLMKLSSAIVWPPGIKCALTAVPDFGQASELNVASRAR